HQRDRHRVQHRKQQDHAERALELAARVAVHQAQLVRKQPQERSGCWHQLATNCKNKSSSDELSCPVPSRSCAQVPSATSLPPCMIPTRSTKRSATSRMCVVKITVQPARTSSSSRSLTSRAMLASSPVSGSSRINSRGSWISAPASAAFCF